MSEADLARRLETLEARLRVLEDAEAIRSLKARYAELVDERYARGAPRSPEEVEPIARKIAELFSEDAVWDGGAWDAAVLAATDTIKDGPNLAVAFEGESGDVLAGYGRSDTSSATAPRAAPVPGRGSSSAPRWARSPSR